MAGQVGSQVYEVLYAPLREQVNGYRRVAHARADNVDLVVEFPPSPRPARVWWATRDHHRGGTLLSETPVALATDGSVHRFVPAPEHAAADFRWTWQPGAGVGRSGGPVRGFTAGARGVRRPDRVRRPS